MEHVGIVVDDLAAATEFFAELGLVLQGEGPSKVAGWTASWGLEGVRTQFAMLQLRTAMDDSSW
jgi:catechol 2,3-dioxygenase-like lactoylglutathione lyase family enzyme